MKTNSIIAAFEYMLIKLAIHFVDEKYPEMLQFDIRAKVMKFNEWNNFSKEKIKLLPFIITIGNGQKENLLNFFQYNFITDTDGFILQEVNDYIFNDSINNESKFVNYFETKIQLKPIICDIISDLERQIIKEYELDGNSISDIFTIISKTIISIKTNRINYLASMSAVVLSEWSRNNEVYSAIQSLDKEAKTDFESSLKSKSDGIFDLFKDVLIKYKFPLTIEEKQLSLR